MLFETVCIMQLKCYSVAHLFFFFFLNMQMYEFFLHENDQKQYCAAYIILYLLYLQYPCSWRTTFQ